MNEDVKPYFVCTGCFVGYKGFEVSHFCLLAEFLVRNIQNVELIIIGSGVNYKNYFALNKKVWNRRITVIFLRALSSIYERLQKIAGASICAQCLQPLNQEMYGLSQIEAYACGTPVITTNLKKSGVPLIANASRSGLVVQPSSVSELVAAMERVFSNQELRTRMRGNARAYYLRCHDVDPLSDQFKAFLEKFVDK